MRIVYHLGAHCTDEERLLRCFLKNRGVLAEQGIVVPGPTRYRNLLRDTAIALKGKPATIETQALVLEQIMEEDRAERLILSWDNFLAFIPWAVDGALYPSAGPRTRAFAQVFPQIEAEFHMGLRNPASFLPQVFHRQKGIKGGKPTVEAFTAGIDIFDLRWSDVVERILDANPEAEITLWCDEDTPLVWPEVLAAVSGAAPGTVLEDADALLSEIMAPEGLERMRTYEASHPVTSVAGRRRMVSAFLEKFAIPAKVEQEVEMAGWTEGTITALAEIYQQDLAYLATLPGVTVIRP
ncbi:hypothetical protein NX862_11280 [Rhodobacter sp. KR11]|uniref:hypothetical protein n=1 Tax=Rhodobacter sp. KR11 TaxID=2974588 RepID=UPI002223264D|nr:hypothetical protein [Rhodobacter sp. KR11]MCW1919340.1 hypothetical protein [Rhodobacter sp. KR11]